MRAVSQTQETKPELKRSPIDPDNPSYHFKRQWIFLSAIALILIAIICWFYFYTTPVERGLKALDRAQKGQRVLQARLTPLSHAAFSVTGGTDSTQAKSDDQNEAGRQLLKSYDKPTALSLHGAALYYLSEKRFDDAIPRLEQAAAIDPKSAIIQADLGAALLESGKSHAWEQKPNLAGEELARAAENLHKAITLDHALRPPVFNLALLYQSSLPHQAAKYWRQYLAMDSNSEWANEARLNLKRLEEAPAATESNAQVINRFLDAYQKGDDHSASGIIDDNRDAIVGRLIYWQLLDSMLDLIANGRSSEAAEQLLAVNYVGRLEHDRNGDDFVAHIAEFYQKAPQAKLITLITAHRMVNRAHELCGESNYADAESLYRQAGGIYAAAGDRLEALYTDYWVGYCMFRLRYYKQADRKLTYVSKQCEESRFLWLGSMALSSLANVADADSEQSRSIELTKEALEISIRIEDRYNSQKNLAQMALSYSGIGRFSDALGFAERCMVMAEDYWPGPRQMWRNLETTTRVLVARGLYAAAADYEQEALRLTLTEAPDPSFIHVSYLQAGMLAELLGDAEDGFWLSEQGYKTAESVPDENTKSNFVAYSNLMLGHLSRQSGRFREAVEYYQRAISDYDKLNIPANTYSAHKGLLFTYLALEDDAQSKRELDVVLNLFDKNRSKIIEESNRNAFLEVEHNIYDTAVDFAISRLHDGKLAFDYAELARARSLLDMIGLGPRGSQETRDNDRLLGGVTEPLEAAALIKSMSEDAQILQYFILENKLLIWVVTKENGLHVVEQSLPAAEINRKVNDYINAVITKADIRKTDELGRQLYAILISPIRSLLVPNKQLCIVPDKILNRLPFASLVSPDSGRYLLESYRLSYSPSSSVFIKKSEAAGGPEDTLEENLLSVGVSEFKDSPFPALDELGEAITEAKDIAHRYANSKVLLRENATEEQVKQNLSLGLYNVIQISTHYITDPQSPMLSGLVFRKQNGGTEDSVLRINEIYDLPLQNAHLVVLSACQTGGEQYFDGEGAIGLARAFIAAGAPTVVASLWPVNSESTEKLMNALHRNRKTMPVPTAEALQKAQMEILATPDHRFAHPYFWAAFQVFGGYNRY